ncbi:MAG: tRNA (N(6)-L-threonylcarbamoyladenosine(37)-C(2))-methylthiotransferase MtaB [Rickettsiales bacterium]|nr:tRNA (N(6)-L-threonylcarbamoyladenosine(37)-C(2))-methylthiotransferase MtaB [Rickettsiales bacterium]
MTEEEDNRVLTFGCRLNAYESELIKSAIKDVDDKNLVVFNSCAVTNKAESDLRNSIRKIKKQNPQAKVVVTGCAAQADAAKYAKMEEVDLVLGNQEKSDPASYEFKNGGKFLSGRDEDKLNHQDKLFFKSKENINNSLSDFEFSKIKVNDIMSVKDTAPQLVSYFEDQTRAFLEIQNGCNHRCTFCIIPFGRGNSRSVSFGEIVEKIKELVVNGHKEVVLTGVDITSYGEDIDIKISLSQMIKRLLKLVPELPRLRLSSVDVAELLDDEDFFDLLKNEPRFMPYLHLSVQSGDDLILKRMKRRHSRQQVLDFCKKCREIRPEITFGCDIIAGFPTESDDAFQNSVNLIREAGLIFCHIFPYSPKEGTPAAKLKQINGAIVKERAKILREVGEKELENYLKKQAGKQQKVLVEKNGMGKTENFLDVEVSSNCKVGEIVEIIL